MFRELAFLFFVLFIPFCTLSPPPSHPSVKAASYLRSQLNPTLGPLRESPETALDVHWLLIDNQLAVWALKASGNESFAADLQFAIDAHHPPPQVTRIPAAASRGQRSQTPLRMAPKDHVQRDTDLLCQSSSRTETAERNTHDLSSSLSLASSSVYRLRPQLRRTVSILRFRKHDAVCYPTSCSNPLPLPMHSWHSPDWAWAAITTGKWFELCRRVREMRHLML